MITNYPSANKTRGCRSPGRACAITWPSAGHVPFAPGLVKPQKLHHRRHIEFVAAIPAFAEPLHIERQRHLILDQQDEIAPIERHGGADLDQHVGLDARLGFARQHIGVDLDDRGVATAHLLHQGRKKRRRRDFIAAEHDWLDLSERDELLDLL
jgi:hypothetical protein